MTYLAARLHELHQGPVKGLDITANRIATGGADGRVRVLAGNGEHVGSITAHEDIVNSVAVAPDGMVASGSRDRTVRLFDTRVGRAYTLGDHDHWVMSVAWSDDGSHLASGSEDGTVGIWVPDDASVVRIRLGSPVNAVDWRGGVIAAATGRGELHLLDDSGTTLRVEGGASQILWDAALSPDGTRVAWVGRDRCLRIAPVAGGDTIVTPAHRAQIWSVSWNEDGTRLATGSADGTAALWADDGRSIGRVRTSTWIRRAGLLGDELYLATEDGRLRIFSTDGSEAPGPPVELPAAPSSCSHWDPRVTDPGPRPRCEECGSHEELRLCVTCGHTGCCESQLAHGTKHWIETGHPNTIPATQGPIRWRWCYEDDIYVTDR